MFESPTRRRFFCGAATATLGLLMPRSSFGSPALSAAHQEASPEARLRRLGIELPPRRSVATYVKPVAVPDRWEHVVCGRPYAAASRTARPATRARSVKMFTIEEGYQAARVAGVNILSTVRNTLGTLHGAEPGVVGISRGSGRRSGAITTSVMDIYSATSWAGPGELGRPGSAELPDMVSPGS